ncbi:holo-[acyl-carrier-protein] synthase Ecym_2409 [Eremothecium cymbalariae DBVPG|uniref:4'-phosphopantetheinyl transferase domain-containing protein n=1 Tax=Eremothecium cymbalariae (strain CBS 270.75 / DBVPG 7215 / KCTC 17166 / NRRL Y-17582) TaxID=931890 RepID=G8JP83_ERECY|nr:Hypothetical protein Ecym_2409 [Eremothecium cymbalariae DBVPG\
MQNNLLGIGTDVVRVSRFLRLMEKYSSKQQQLSDQRAGRNGFERFTKKFMHPYEVKQFYGEVVEAATTASGRCSSVQQMRNARYLAGIWATKEAIYKALVSGLQRPNALPAASAIYKQFYKSNDAVTGCPVINVDVGGFRETAGLERFWNMHVKGSRFLLSVSHDGDYVVTFVCQVKDETCSEHRDNQEEESC